MNSSKVTCGAIKRANAYPSPEAPPGDVSLPSDCNTIELARLTATLLIIIESMENTIQTLEKEVGAIRAALDPYKNPIWTTAILAQMVGRSEETVRTWVRQKKLTAISIPGDKNSYLFIASKVLEELESYATQ